MVEVFSFDVTISSYDLLRQGVTEAGVGFDAARFIRVFIAADTQHEAELTAFEMVTLTVARYNADVMITGIYPRF